jgi:hypothetical protein
MIDRQRADGFVVRIDPRPPFGHVSSGDVDDRTATGVEHARQRPGLHPGDQGVAGHHLQPAVDISGTQ